MPKIKNVLRQQNKQESQEMHLIKDSAHALNKRQVTLKTVAFGSRVLKNLESGYCTNKIAVVRFLIYFKYYLCGSKFLLQADHNALFTTLKKKLEIKLS